MKKTVSELWNEIFIDYDIISKVENEGFFKITADEIRKYKEPRLMAKFDFSKQLPEVFKKNRYGILPIKNGEYIIGKFNLFEKISNYEDIEINKTTLPSFIETIDPDNIYSESNALNVALLSGMFEKAFGEKVYETIQGKMRTNYFNFYINGENVSNRVEVNGAAIEIDGGYESEKNVYLIEAKNSMPNDFVIRQLYYPYRHWKDKVLKNIIPVFFAYENGVYNLFQYEFKNDSEYNSIELKTIKRFMLSSKDSEEIKKELFEKTELVEELEQNVVPFPQADSFTRVLNTLELIGNEINSANKIAESFEFDPRQGKYYIDALRYLGYVKKSSNTGEYEFTPTGMALSYMDVKMRNKEIFQEIIKHKPFYVVYKYYLEKGELPERNYIKEYLKDLIPELSDETANRRASTVRGWILWMIGCQI